MNVRVITRPAEEQRRSEEESRDQSELLRRRNLVVVVPTTNEHIIVRRSFVFDAIYNEHRRTSSIIIICLSVHQTLSKCRPVVTRPTRLCGGRAQLLSRTPATRKKLYLERRGFLVMSSARSHTAEFQQDS